MFYKIKQTFIEHVRINNYCNELMDLYSFKERGYFYVISIKNKEFLIPLRSEITHKYKYTLDDGKSGLDYTKSIPLVNRKILDGPFKILSNAELEKQYHSKIREIVTDYNKYYSKHKNLSYSTDHEGLIIAQKTFK